MDFLTVRSSIGRSTRSEERRVGKECRYRCDWSSDVCSSDLRTVRKSITEIKDSGMVLFYLHDGLPYGAFKHWKKHQKINKAVPSELPPPPDPGVVRENSVPKPGERRSRSGNDNGVLLDDSFSHAQARVPILSCSTEDLSELGPDHAPALCAHLAGCIRRNDPYADPNWESERWANDMRLLLADRGNNGAAWFEVLRVINWTHDDDFERAVVLAPAK